MADAVFILRHQADTVSNTAREEQRRRARELGGLVRRYTHDSR